MLVGVAGVCEKVSVLAAALCEDKSLLSQGVEVGETVSVAIEYFSFASEVAASFVALSSER